ncbi:unnamed protein product [Periconia digitata]|uniref:Fe2OG dioxygenase domain-containing protein n=1 Tax=Periconia digitata TaxID=1303443 RepID=A0A9W4XPZ9_9PLEO|nr:unnamed protein product [Periconia digitata]
MADAQLSDSENTLERYRVITLPPDFFYIPNFITKEEEESILQKIPAQRWITLSHRRLQAHPSTLTKNNTLLASPLPQWLEKPVIDRFKSMGLFDSTPHKAPNHVLVNEYNSGEGIMPHEDGSAYAHVVATVSLGASICLEITAKPASKKVDQENNISDNTSSQYMIPTRILQEPRSLLITTGQAYENLLHGIASIEVDEDLNAQTVANWDLLFDPTVFQKAGGRNERSTRVSLTYRDVLKVSSAASKVLGGLGRR